MAFSIQEKAQILREYHRTRSITLTRRWVRLVLSKEPPFRSDILRWERSFMERGNLAHRGGNGRPRISTEKINEVRVMFRDNPRLSIRAAAESLDMPRSTVQHILRKCLGLFPYKIQNCTL